MTVRTLSALLGCLVLTAPALAEEVYIYRHVHPGAQFKPGDWGTDPEAGTNNPATPAPLALGLGGAISGVSVGEGSGIRFEATGGQAPYTFASADPLPPGLSLGSDGSLVGTFGYAGTYAVTVVATDAAGSSKSMSATIEVRPQPPAIAVGTPAGVGNKPLLAGFPFSVQANQTAGGMLTWGVTSPWAVNSQGLVTGTLPEGTTALSLTVRGTDVFERFGEGSLDAVPVEQPTLTMSRSSVSIQEGAEASLAGDTNLPSPTFTMSGAGTGSTIDGGGNVVVYGGDVEADATSRVQVTAASGGVSRTADFDVTVRRATGSIDAVSVRGGDSFSTTLRTDLAAAGTWSMTSPPADVTLFPVEATQVATLSGVAPANAGSSSVTRQLSAAFTAGGPARVPAASRAKATATGTLTIYPTLAFASAPAEIKGNPDKALAVPAPPTVNGRVGGVRYSLLYEDKPLANDISTVCSGMTFDPATGQIGGTPKANCSFSLKYVATDDGGGVMPSKQATSAGFAVTIDLPGNPLASVTAPISVDWDQVVSRGAVTAPLYGMYDGVDSTWVATGYTWGRINLRFASAVQSDCITVKTPSGSLANGNKVRFELWSGNANTVSTYDAFSLSNASNHVYRFTKRTDITTVSIAVYTAGNYVWITDYRAGIWDGSACIVPSNRT